MSFGGNTRGMFTLEIMESGDQASLWLSDGNTPRVMCSLFARGPSLSQEDGLELMACLWYQYGMAKPVSTQQEWNFFQAYWEMEVFQRFNISAKHPRELIQFIRMEGGVLDTHTGNAMAFIARDKPLCVGNDLAHLLPTHTVRRWITMHSVPPSSTCCDSQ